MQKPNPIILSILTVVLLTSTCVSLAQAQEVSPPPERSAVPDATSTDSANNATSPDNSNQLISTLDDNSSAPLIAPGPSDASGEEQQNLIATQTDNTVLIGAIAAVIVAAVGISVFLFFRYRARTRTH